MTRRCSTFMTCVRVQLVVSHANENPSVSISVTDELLDGTRDLQRLEVHLGTIESCGRSVREWFGDLMAVLDAEAF